jgi:hypothetical protein
MSDKTLSPQEQKLKEEIDAILDKQAKEKAAKAEETSKKIAEAQKSGPDPKAPLHPIYRSF